MTDTQSLMSAAYDSRSLNNLKREAAADPKGKALQVAKQVEGMFVQMMLKSMREALPQDGIFSSDSTKMYTSMYDQQIAQEIGKRGLGMADLIVKQMQPAQEPDETAGTVPMKLDNSFIYSNLPSNQLEQMVRKAVPRLPVSPSSFPADSNDFIAQLSQPAQAASQQSGIPHHLILAQAALESGWGQRQILTRDGKPSYNVFGIKAGGDWKGATTDIMTTEYEGGVAKKVRATFRVYGSYMEALSDYVKLLSNNPRYAAVANAATPEQGARALQAAGYATDPKYAQKLVGMIQQFKNMGEKVVKAYSQDITDLF
ncbi:flagellar assembly peptidoglycan hydrolase FlgJ [Pantoea sp. JGM49]|jgi:flagellar rod assembly protein/muramidase FlgJ|uniref:Peptidoglycan hydrolase FlgJ n=1 Tax=Pantoea rwandensis TaxID=1076550 RepID=A0ABM5RKQ8_9GAMM|nr:MULTISPECIES: flagellar assembly peptidoglycan hydrolase FlgJ [Enterobacterales]MDF7628263.1 flagellar assembly peptidoglycan hydrolase FlgJ [Erwiniaceae bacterium L1_55_4]AIR86672.1 flagellar rod assembly protein FlgJ [Pantoea rwandensis]KGT86713.1 flagellar rod assembly protein FlgJ [Enterobacter cancerogenus]KJV34940.1 flagellar rod assembly protein FlgJ [Pantoea sp. SM3]MBK0090477.1 flagellar assembly peptidoglycan hydrolase FlgJ [Erwinia sp. S59]